MSYHIIDEPKPSPLAKATVNPLLPLLAIMLAGAWLAWPWFLFNSFAMGSPTRRREIIWIVAGFIGAFIIVLTIANLLVSEVLLKEHVPYVLLILVAWKIGISYKVYMLQAYTYQIYEYFGGESANSVWVIIGVVFIAFYIGDGFLAFLPDVLAFVLK